MHGRKVAASTPPCGVGRFAAGRDRMGGACWAVTIARGRRSGHEVLVVKGVRVAHRPSSGSAFEASAMGNYGSVAPVPVWARAAEALRRERHAYGLVSSNDCRNRGFVRTTYFFKNELLVSSRSSSGIGAARAVMRSPKQTRRDGRPERTKANCYDRSCATLISPKLNFGKIPKCSQDTMLRRGFTRKTE